MFEKELPVHDLDSIIKCGILSEEELESLLKSRILTYKMNDIEEIRKKITNISEVPIKSNNKKKNRSQAYPK